MADQFQLTTIIAAAIRDCHQATVSSQQRGEKAVSLSAEDANCIAKAVLTVLADAGLEIAPKAAI
jgi:hypothetical protein